MDNKGNSHQQTLVQLQNELDQARAELIQVKKELRNMEKIKIQMESCNKDLRLEVEKLNCLLRLCQATNTSYGSTADVEIQVDEKTIARDLDYAYYAHGNQATALHHSETGVEQTLAGCGTTEESSVAPWTQTDTQQEEEDVEEGEVKDEPVSIADSLKEAAESAIEQCGYVYDEKTGLYYDHNSGYYYDPTNQLYYEPLSGTYYYYNPDTCSYTFHSQVDLPSNSQYRSTDKPQSGTSYSDRQPCPQNCRDVSQFQQACDSQERMNFNSLNSTPSAHNPNYPNRCPSPNSCNYPNRYPPPDNISYPEQSLPPQNYRGDIQTRNIETNELPPVAIDSGRRRKRKRKPKERKKKPEKKEDGKNEEQADETPDGKTGEKTEIEAKPGDKNDEINEENPADKSSTISSKPTIYVATAAKKAKFDLSSRRVTFSKPEEERKDGVLDSKTDAAVLDSKNDDLCDCKSLSPACVHSAMSETKVIKGRGEASSGGVDEVADVEVCDTVNNARTLSDNPDQIGKPVIGPSLELFMQFAQKSKLKMEGSQNLSCDESEQSKSSVELKITETTDRIIVSKSVESDQCLEGRNIAENPLENLKGQGSCVEETAEEQMEICEVKKETKEQTERIIIDSDQSSVLMEGEDWLNELDELIHETFVGDIKSEDTAEHGVKVKTVDAGSNKIMEKCSYSEEGHVTDLAKDSGDTFLNPEDSSSVQNVKVSKQTDLTSSVTIVSTSPKTLRSETPGEEFSGIVDRNVICDGGSSKSTASAISTICIKTDVNKDSVSVVEMAEDGVDVTSGNVLNRHMGIEDLDDLLSMDSDEDSEDSVGLEDGEICEVDEDQLDDNIREDTIDQKEEPYADSMQTEESCEVGTTHFPPCIRAMVTDSDKLRVGDLHIITCTGVTIGSDTKENHGVVIQDTGVSRTHCNIVYYEVERSYIIQDCGSQNGTFLNGKRLSKAREVSEWFRLQHKDTLTVGGTALCLHIHSGTTTCAECEPGVVQAGHSKKDVESTPVHKKCDLEKLRRKELKQIKKKFGLENSAYVTEPQTGSNYRDKAAERRKTLGSDNPYQKDNPSASVHVAISTENKGRKLLAKMGWKEGESLGKSTTGITEPAREEAEQRSFSILQSEPKQIQVGVRTSQTAGLGSLGDMSHSLDDIQGVRHTARWLKTKQRYQDIEQSHDNKSRETGTQAPKKS